ncbi:hypothetical protein [Spirillospora sp. NBC_01491]|uniref:hypothetical protein n=1 Tax=Spirillospora sp. NBC_01491 TaxID=2976007 RepID=UPI002E331E52|nr:hypothetical protein [Spirillospora sp. NBC_01491]
MSGGSYNYLCWVTHHHPLLEKLATMRGDLDDMSTRLAELGYAPDAAAETEELLLLLRQWENRAQARVNRLADVWKAVEWWDSCDWGEDRVHEALAAYRGDEQQPKETP